MRFVGLGDAAKPDERDHRAYAEAVKGLIPAWWRVGRHEEAEPWLRHDPSAIAARARGHHLAYLAALGRVAEARPCVAQLAMTTDLWDLRRTALGPLVEQVLLMTPDRPLAVDALRALVAHPLFENELASGSPSPFTRLADLGEHAFVEQQLTAWLRRIEALPPKARDLPCRDLARHAAAAGRTDLARAAAELPGKSARRYSALGWALGCVNVGDWNGAMAALDRTPPEARVSTAFSMADAAEQAGCYGPRALSAP